jgi:hypothetical protein
MKILCLLFALFSFSAMAGFAGYNQGASLKIFDSVDCSEGIECTRVKNKFTIAFDGQSGASTLQNRVAAVAGAITSTQCGSTFYNTAAVAMNLPEASTVLGCRLTFVTLNAANFDVNPEAADQILVQTDAAGDMIRNATLGNTVTIEAVSASQWAVVGILGTWADAN